MPASATASAAEQSAPWLPLASATGAGSALPTDRSQTSSVGTHAVADAQAGAESSDATQHPPASVSTTADPAPAGLSPSVAPVQEEVVVTEQPTARKDLWERLRQGLKVTDLDGPLVRQWERWYADRPDYVQRMTERGARYLFHIVEEVDRRGMPMELALLPFIESAFNPRAMSTARASGIWQFMPATGRDFDLKQNLFRDDRRSVQASTRAALDYLQSLHGMFGDWHLALAAYNWGQGNVQRALTRNERGRLPVDYESLRMPEETRHYVPKLQAVENIVRDPERFGLNLPALENHPFFLSVPVERDIDVHLAARLAELPLEEFHALNPQLNKPVVLAAGTPELLLPYDNARKFLSARLSHDGPLASWTAWVAPRTVRPADVARIVGMSETQLREVNRIPAGMKIQQGSTLLVARAPHVDNDVSEKIADTAAIQLAPEAPLLRKRVVKVGKKPVSLAILARRHGVDRAQLARWNSLPIDAVVQPGQRLILMVTAPTSSPGKARPGPRPAVQGPGQARGKARPGPGAKSSAANPQAKADRRNPQRLAAPVRTPKSEKSSRKGPAR